MASLGLTFLGSGDAFSSQGRLQSGILIQSQQAGLLLDCGATLLAGLHRYGLNTNQIDFIAISHLHGDHFAGIPFLLLDALFASKRRNSLTILGPAGIEDRVESLCQTLYPGALDGPFPFPLNYQEFSPGQTLDHPFFNMSLFAAKHGQSSAACSLRVDIEDRIIAYSGDTEWQDSLIELTEGSDLFICECCNFDQSIPGHLDYLTLEKHLAQLKTTRLILTHTGPTIDENRSAIACEIATDGLKLQL